MSGTIRYCWPRTSRWCARRWPRCSAWRTTSRWSPRSPAATRSSARPVTQRRDVALLDIEMPGMHRHRGGRRAPRGAARGTSVVILTTFGRPGYLRRAMEAGADAFLVKDAPAAQLAEAVRRVLRGRAGHRPELAAAALADGRQPAHRRASARSCARRPTAPPTRTSPARLHLSQGTVRNYLSTAIQKTAARNRTEAVRIARERAGSRGRAAYPEAARTHRDRPAPRQFRSARAARACRRTAVAVVGSASSSTSAYASSSARPGEIPRAHQQLAPARSATGPDVRAAAGTAPPPTAASAVLRPGRGPRPDVVEHPQHDVQRVGRLQHRRGRRGPRRARHQQRRVLPGEPPPAVEGIDQHAAPAGSPKPTTKCPGRATPYTGAPARRPTSIHTTDSRIGSPRRRRSTSCSSEDSSRW